MTQRRAPSSIFLLVASAEARHGPSSPWSPACWTGGDAEEQLVTVVFVWVLPTAQRSRDAGWAPFCHNILSHVTKQLFDVPETSSTKPMLGAPGHMAQEQGFEQHPS